MTDGIRFRIEEGVGWIVLDRPDRRNAFTLEMIDAWAAFLVAARTDPDIRVVVLTGEGGAFCAGVDLDSFHAERVSVLADKRLLSDRVHRIAFALEDLDKPVIAAVDGVAVGAGMDMALMCDIRLASARARFSEGYIRVGLVPGDGGCFFLPRIVGTARALELLWTGDFVESDEMERIGLVSHVWPVEEFAERVAAFAARLAAAPPISVGMIKRSVVLGARQDLRTALDLISSHQAVVQATEDSAEAYRAFREKRAGHYVGR